MSCEVTLLERIRKYRLNMLVHSYLYYHLDIALISDNKWQQWANELTTLQAEHGTVFGVYDDVFKDWDGSTGMHLPVDDWVFSTSHKLLRYCNFETKTKDKKE